MTRSTRSLLTAALLTGAACMTAHGGQASVTVNSDTVANAIHPHVYGHFFEHIYHSANNGLWGEAVWNRSFEQNRENLMGSPGWSRDGDVVSYAGDEPQTRLFGGNEYRDFDYTVDVRKAAGDGAVRVFFRGQAALTLGAKGNTVHALERVAPPGRGPQQQTQSQPVALAEPVPGALEVDRWHAVRVRMEGQHLQAWLDGKPLFDTRVPLPPARGTPPPAGATTQTSQPAGPRGPFVTPAGYIGVGAVGAKAQFRNFLVKGLDGTVFWDRPLYANVPDTALTREPAEDGRTREVSVERWGLTGGTARVVTEPGQALNDARCLEITGNGQSVLSQPDFYVKADDPLEGSLWLKGRATGGATVQLVDGDAVLAEQKVDAPAGEWKEFPLRLASTKGSDAATLRIVFDGEHRVMIDQVSLMPESAKKTGGFRPDLLDAFRGLQPTTMRWPGGCFAESYQWKHGIGPQKDRKKSQRPWWEEFDPNALGTDEYIQLSRLLNSEPLLVIQTGMHQGRGTRTPEEWEPFVVEALEWIEYCNGPATSKWGAVRAANGHPEPYNVKLWEIDNELWRSRVRDPETYARAVNLFSKRMKEKDPSITVIAHGGNGTDRRYNIPVVNNAAENFSVLSIHHYTGPDDFITGIDAQDRLYADVTKLIKGSKNPDAKIYVSEWNAQTTDWRTGVYAGGLLNVFEKHGDVLTMAGPALMVRHLSAHDWDNGFINFDQKGWFPGPNYVVMKLFREHYAPQRLQSNTADEKSLNLVATRTEDGSQVILKAVNLTNEPLDVGTTIDGQFRPKQAAMKIIAPPSTQTRNSMAAKDNVKAVDATAEVNGNVVRFSLPPYAVATLRVTR